MPAESHIMVRLVARRGIETGSYGRAAACERAKKRRKQRLAGRLLRRRAHSETVSTTFRCKTCGAEFLTPELLGAHWRSEHPEVFSDDWKCRRRRR